MLTKIKNYVESRGMVSLQDIALHFDVQPSAMQGMLQVWVNKGALKVSSAAADCNSNCGRCDAAGSEMYSSTTSVISLNL